MRFERPCKVWEVLIFWEAWKEDLEGGPGREQALRCGRPGGLACPWALKGSEALNVGKLGDPGLEFWEALRRGRPCILGRSEVLRYRPIGGAEAEPAGLSVERIKRHRRRPPS